MIANGARDYVVNWNHPKKSIQEYQGIGIERKPLSTFAELVLLSTARTDRKFLGDLPQRARQPGKGPNRA
ncbi:hypothetical protein ABEB36_000035 [Hypothenemus hampei]|uniref:Uncharacterized protein n=1 Tax=Hypothenemus hampei TaxID=57062 RepID=A0ABD1FA40_HYPHA